MIRDSQNSVLGGVCAGIAKRYNLDRTIVRAGAVLAMFATGVFTMVVVYGLAWYFMEPSDKGDGSVTSPNHVFSAENTGRVIQEDLDKVGKKFKKVETAFSSGVKSFKSEMSKK